MSEQQDIFNLSPDDFKIPDRKPAASKFYSPDPKDAKDGVYRAVLRFIVNPANVKASIVKKVVHWLSEGERSGFYVDCPSSIGEPSIVKDTYWKLKGSNSAYEQKQAESIGHKEYYFSYVYVVKDFQDPNLNGTVQVLRYPKTIRKMIEAQLNPDQMAIEQGAVPTNIFDFFEGKDFYLSVGMKSNFKNYDSCKFGESKQPIAINGVRMQKNAECMKAIKALYPEDLVPLDSFGYKPWTPELQDRVATFLSNLTGTRVSPAVARVTTPQRNVEEAAAPMAPVASPVEAKSDVPAGFDDPTQAPGDEIEEWLKGIGK